MKVTVFLNIYQDSGINPIKDVQHLYQKIYKLAKLKDLNKWRDISGSQK